MWSFDFAEKHSIVNTLLQVHKVTDTIPHLPQIPTDEPKMS